MPQYIQNIINYFKSLASREDVVASHPKDWAVGINQRDGKLIGLCNYFKLKRLQEIGQRTLTEVAVTPTSVAITGTGTQQMTAVAKYDNGDQVTVTTGAAWASSNESAATVSSAGLVTGVAAGSSNITAVFGGVTSNIVVATIS